MKKFASITIAMLMAVSMMLSSVVSTSARTAGTGIDRTKKGTITLTKYETESKMTKPVDGAEFTAYKVMDLTADADGDATFTVDPDLDGVVSASDLVHTGKIGSQGGLFVSAKELEDKVPAIEAKAASLEATKFTGLGNNTGKYVASDLDLGIYLVVETIVPNGYIKGSQSFLVSVPEWNNTTGQWVYEIEAQPKNTPVTLIKTIKDPDKNNDLVNEATFAIGNVVDYNVQAQIPNYGVSPLDSTKKYSQYLKTEAPDKYSKLKMSFTDTFDEGLTFVGADSIIIKTDTYEFKQGTDYIVEVTGQKFEIKFENWDRVYQYEGQTIYLEYQAVVNENAKIESANVNEVVFKFVNDPNKSTTQELHDPAYVYSFQMNVNKTFEGKTAADAGVNATVVTFKLYKKGSSTPIKFIEKAAGNYVAYDKEKDEADPASLVEEIKLNTTGALSVKGLEEGTYLLEETKTVEGYAIPTTQMEIEVGEKPMTLEGNNFKTIGVDPAHCLSDGSKSPLKLVEGTTNTFELTVNNVFKQFTLPTTGGEGILFFTIAGGILMAAAIILFTSLKKKRAC